MGEKRHFPFTRGFHLPRKKVGTTGRYCPENNPTALFKVDLAKAFNPSQ